MKEPIKFKSFPENKPIEVFLRLCDEYERAFLFESVGDGGDSSRFSFLGFDPEVTVTVKDCVAYIDGERLE
ncbi:MAG: hypothetical protein QW782_09015, partial [Candidatus Bathyarchaeia archaeon]